MNVKVLNLIATGGVGGIETLCLNSAAYTCNENTYMFLRNEGPISEEMVSKGYHVEFLNTSIRKYMSDAVKVAMICKRKKYDVVVCHYINPFEALCAVWIHMLSKDTRIIGYMHSAPDDWKKRHLFSAKIIFKHAQKIICISDFILNSTKKYIGFEDKLVRIYNGVDISKFSPKTTVSEKKRHRLIYVGRLTEKKGVKVILDALSQVTVDYQFNIIGDGDYRVELEKHAKALGLDEKVRFFGSQQDVQRFLSEADIFIHVPVLEEGFGLTVVEAMASGLLCICSKSGALPEIVEDGVTGYLVEKNSPEELAQAIQTAIENYESEKITEIRNRAKCKAKEYSINGYITEVDNLVAKVSLRGGVKLIYVGRLERVKGVQNTLKLLSEIKDIPYLFQIVGDGHYRKELEALTHELGIADQVEFLGERRDVPELLWQADIFVHLPEWQEGFGITVIEALAAGLICIVNDHGALPEIIQDGINGFVIHDNDCRRFEEIIKAVLYDQNGAEIEEMRRASIMRAKEFSIQKYSAMLDKLLME